MARQLRIDYPGAWHHVMNRGRRREQIFLNIEDRVAFLRLLAVASERFNVRINAFCLMGNHYHLLICTPTGGISQVMKYIDGVYAQGFNRRYEIDGPLFRGRFHSKLVESDGYLGQLVGYIHRNPLEFVDAKDLESYQWSSYPSFLAKPSRRPAWLFSDALAMSGIDTARELRRRTLGSGFTDFDPKKFPEAIGSPEFINAALARAKSDEQTIGHVRVGVSRPSPEQIQSRVEEVFNAGTDEARLVEVGLCQELGGLSLAAVADRFGYRSAQSAGSATHRFRTRLEDEQWGLLVEKVRRGLEGQRVDEKFRK